MTVEDCIELVMKKSVEYVEQYREDEIKLITNFPSVFLHYFRVLKTSCSDYNYTYFNLRFAQSKYLDFTIKNNEIKHLQFVHYDAASDNLRNRINKCIELYLGGHEWDKEYASKIENSYTHHVSIPNNSTTIKKEQKTDLVIDLTSLDKFKF